MKHEEAYIRLSGDGGRGERKTQKNRWNVL